MVAVQGVREDLGSVTEWHWRRSFGFPLDHCILESVGIYWDWTSAFFPVVVSVKDVRSTSNWMIRWTDVGLITGWARLAQRQRKGKNDFYPDRV